MFGCSTYRAGAISCLCESRRQSFTNVSRLGLIILKTQAIQWKRDGIGRLTASVVEYNPETWSVNRHQRPKLLEQSEMPAKQHVVHRVWMRSARNLIPSRMSIAE